MKRLLFIFSFFFLFVLRGNTQEVEILTLEDCLRIGIDNNLSLEGKRKEIQKSKYGVSENRSKLLPQINAIAGYNNNFDPPVSVTDGSSYGVPYNITKTLQHSANAGLEMQMPLFNQTLYTSMSIAKVMEEISRLSYGKAREDVILQISKMYYLGQVTAEQIMLIKANIIRLEELRDITQAFFDNGMSMEVDLKRVTTIGFLIGMFIPEIVSSIFTSDAELISIASKGFRVVVFFYPIVGFQMVASNFFQSIGMASKAIFLSLTRQMLFLVPCLLILPHYYGQMGVWASMPVADLAASLISGGMLWWQFRQFKKVTV